MTEKDEIRLAVPGDAPGILAVYAPYVTDTAITFEIEVPALEEFAGRVEATGIQYPYLVYCAGGEIVGYAYATRHRARAAYRFDVESSIYVSEAYHGHGVAYKLYRCLFAILEKMDYINVYAGASASNGKSMVFHERFGFSLIGVYHKTGYKLGAWHDTAWYEKALKPIGDEIPTEPKSIREVPREWLNALFRDVMSQNS